MFSMSLVAWELNGDGINHDTFHTTLTPESDFSVATIMWMLALDLVLFWLVTLLIDRMRSTGDGLPSVLHYAAQWMAPHGSEAPRLLQSARPVALPHHPPVHCFMQPLRSQGTAPYLNAPDVSNIAQCVPPTTWGGGQHLKVACV
jgi:hypothetical protein